MKLNDLHFLPDHFTCVLLYYLYYISLNSVKKKNNKSQKCYYAPRARRSLTGGAKENCGMGARRGGTHQKKLEKLGTRMIDVPLLLVKVPLFTFP